MTELHVVDGVDAVPADRAHLALVAAWEIDGLVGFLMTNLDEIGLMESDALPIRSTLRRIKKLAEVQMSAIDDDEEPIDEIQARFDA